MSRKPRLLTPAEARGSFAARIASIADAGRDLEARLGLRPYVVNLVWIHWTGSERGEGCPQVACRRPLLPIPVVDDLTSLRLNAFSAGRFPVGSVRLSGISATYRQEYLEGTVLPDDPEEEIPEPWDFFYEIVEDGRHGKEPERKRFSVSATPFLDAENQQWIVVLDRQSGDPNRDGTMTKKEPAKPDPWKTRKIEPPPDDDF